MHKSVCLRPPENGGGFRFATPPGRYVGHAGSGIARAGTPGQPSCRSLKKSYRADQQLQYVRAGLLHRVGLVMPGHLRPSGLGWAVGPGPIGHPVGEIM